MVSTNMRVSEIIEIYEKARKENRVPYKPRKRTDDFQLIFEEKCEELKDGRKTIIQDRSGWMVE